MKKVLYPKDCISIDGRMDEPVWDEVREYTDFKRKKVNGGGLATVQTAFKIIPCEDRIYIGVKCMEPDMAYVKKVNPTLEEIAESMHMTVTEIETVRKFLDNARLVGKAHEVKEPEEETPEDTQAVEDTAYFQSRQRVNELMTKVTGVHDIYFCFAGEGYEIDTWKFSK